MIPDDRPPELRWSSFSERERWKVWWGITWRGFLVSVVFFTVATMFATCVGANLVPT